MARFDVYPNSDGVGFLLDVQADLLSGLNTRVVVPLLPSDRAPRPATRLNPVFDVANRPHVMVTQFLAAIPTSALTPAVASLARHDHAIVGALDMLFSGF